MTCNRVIIIDGGKIRRRHPGQPDRPDARRRPCPVELQADPEVAAAALGRIEGAPRDARAP